MFFFRRSLICKRGKSRARMVARLHVEVRGLRLRKTRSSSSVEFKMIIYWFFYEVPPLEGELTSRSSNSINLPSAEVAISVRDIAPIPLSLSPPVLSTFELNPSIQVRKCIYIK